jgi:formylglycine-generating enzyme required for sulfatase activity
MRCAMKIAPVVLLATTILGISEMPAIAQSQSATPSIEELEKQLEEKRAEKTKPRSAAKSTEAPVPASRSPRVVTKSPAATESPPKPSPEDVARLIADIDARMVEIPAGSFLMGSAAGDPEEKLVHLVMVPAFRLSVYDVTFDEYDVFAIATGRLRPNDEGWGRGRRPVINVSWDDAQAFIGWLKDRSGKRFRLPSEAEWEYAARGGSTTDYPWGNEFDISRANGNSIKDRTVPVGTFASNKFRVCEVVGNVSQWTQDCWHLSYKGAPTDGSAWTSGDCTCRVYRGGAWFNSPFLLRVPSRGCSRSEASGNGLGFRLAEDL